MFGKKNFNVSELVGQYDAFLFLAEKDGKCVIGMEGSGLDISFLFTQLFKKIEPTQELAKSALAYVQNKEKENKTEEKGKKKDGKGKN